jgi:hypothetical protein
MEYGSIEREFHVEASPEVVFDVISSPVHIREWWNAEADFDPAPGSTGELVWGDRASGDAQIAAVLLPLGVFRRCRCSGGQFTAGDLRAPAGGRGHQGPDEGDRIP